MYQPIEVSPDTQLRNLITHPDMWDWQIQSLMHLLVYRTQYLIVIFKQLALHCVGDGHRYPLLGRNYIDKQGLLLREHLDLELSLGSHEDDEFVVLRGEVEEDHVVFGAVLHVEFDVDVEAFGEGPFYAFVDHAHP